MTRGRIDRAAVAALLERARREVEQGLLPSAQVALAHRGELVAFETFGQATAGIPINVEVDRSTQAIVETVERVVRELGLAPRQ